VGGCTSFWAGGQADVYPACNCAIQPCYCYGSCSHGLQAAAAGETVQRLRASISPAVSVHFVCWAQRGYGSLRLFKQRQLLAEPLEEDFCQRQPPSLPRAGVCFCGEPLVSPLTSLCRLLVLPILSGELCLRVVAQPWRCATAFTHVWLRMRGMLCYPSLAYRHTAYTLPVRGAAAQDLLPASKAIFFLTGGNMKGDIKAEGGDDVAGACAAVRLHCQRRYHVTLPTGGILWKRLQYWRTQPFVQHLGVRRMPVSCVDIVGWFICKTVGG